MKLIIDFSRRADWKSGAKVCCLVLALVAGSGCGKSKDAAPQVAPPLTSDSNSAAAKTITPPPIRMQTTAPSGAQNDAGPTQVQFLNRAMLGWEMKNRRRPSNFEEFAASAGVSIPAPPPGKKYALSPRGFIILVNSNQ